MKISKCSVAMAVFAASVIASQASVVVSTDQGYGPSADVFTLDPELNTPAARGINNTRQLRQTFVLDSDITVTNFTLSINVTADDDLVVNFYEVTDPLGANWAAVGATNLIKTFTQSTVGVRSDANITFALDGVDTFGMTIGNYAVEVTSLGGGPGVIRHSNSGTDVYTSGLFYKEDGAISRADRDFGVAINSIPEPATLGLVGIFGAGMMYIRRRLRL